MRIVETPEFFRRASEWLDDLEHWDLQLTLALRPTAGKLIKGGRGLRKLRWSSARQGRGTRGGLRIIYYYKVGDAVYLLTLYPKSEREDLAALELQALVKWVEGLKP